MRRHAIRGGLVLCLAAATFAAAGCGEEVAPGAITAETATAPIIPPEGAMGHGTHDSKHAGVVLMSGEMHFEVVLNPAGKYRVYFSDAARNDLPASIASVATITVTRPGGDTPEPITLKIDESGESWIGEGRPVENLETMARISYTAQGKPYWIDLPFSAAQPQPPASLARPADEAPEKPEVAEAKP